ncbi:diguanylate cyclase [Halomonas sp. G15]|uniref:sensor domain-containing diguanylate cyclase n=1 Tax=Halomonas sp. G15 TaxID=2903521 RepID=UPI001E6086C5|nr:diguanylate cyclase [Halomonas sp. G15]MCE0731772.1 diguanylate cyclase [Halomonas sp. G15]
MHGNTQRSSLPTEAAPVPLDAEACLAALTRGSTALMTMEHWTDGVGQLLAELGPVTGASRVWILQVVEMRLDKVVQDYVFEWAASERYQLLDYYRGRLFATSRDEPEYQQLVAERQRGWRHDFCTPRLPEGPIRRHLESQETLSMATVPIFVDGRWWGTLGVDDCERGVSWEGAGLDLLEAAARMVTAALYRYQLNHRSRQVELFHKVADCGVWEVSLRNGRVWCSQGLKLALGYPESYPRLPLRRLAARLHPEDRAAIWSRLRAARHTPGHAQFRLDIRVRFSRDTWSWYEIIAELEHNEQGTPVALAGVLVDIGRRKHEEEQAQAASECDALTGALNRRGLDRWMAEGPVASPRHLILLDIDHFKRINDTYGHLVGDAFLSCLVDRLAQELRPEDCLVRLGGEEFGVLATSMQDRQVMSLAERLRRRVAEAPFCVKVPGQGAPLSVGMTISLGVARQSRDDADALGQLMAEADEALYAAKHAGRNVVVAFPGH